MEIDDEARATARLAGYRTVQQLARVVGYFPEVIRLDLRQGRIQADRPGLQYFFTPRQWRAAIRYYQRAKEAASAEWNDS